MPSLRLDSGLYVLFCGSARVLLTEAVLYDSDRRWFWKLLPSVLQTPSTRWRNATSRLRNFSWASQGFWKGPYLQVSIVAFPVAAIPNDAVCEI